MPAGAARGGGGGRARDAAGGGRPRGASALVTAAATSATLPAAGAPLGRATAPVPGGGDATGAGAGAATAGAVGSGGLRHFAARVVEAVRELSPTTYAAVADVLVADLPGATEAGDTSCSSAGSAVTRVGGAGADATGATDSVDGVPGGGGGGVNGGGSGASGGADASGDRAGRLRAAEKNARRRVYDALNVLLAIELVGKVGKVITWVGAPTPSAATSACVPRVPWGETPVQRLTRLVEERRAVVARKAKEVAAVEVVLAAASAIVERNQRAAGVVCVAPHGPVGVDGGMRVVIGPGVGASAGGAAPLLSGARSEGLPLGMGGVGLGLGLGLGLSGVGGLPVGGSTGANDFLADLSAVGAVGVDRSGLLVVDAPPDDLPSSCADQLLLLGEEDPLAADADAASELLSLPGVEAGEGLGGAFAMEAWDDAASVGDGCPGEVAYGLGRLGSVGGAGGSPAPRARPVRARRDGGSSGRGASRGRVGRTTGQVSSGASLSPPRAHLSAPCPAAVPLDGRPAAGVSRLHLPFTLLAAPSTASMRLDTEEDGRAAVFTCNAACRVLDGASVLAAVAKQAAARRRAEAAGEAKLPL